MDENKLIESAKAGDLDSFNRLVLAYQDMVFTQAYRVMNELAAAEDATQEAFISAYKSIGSFRGGSFKAWLLRIVTNACYDELRRRQRKPTVAIEPDDTEDDYIDSNPWLADPSESPEERAVRMELNRAIQRCLDTLPDEFRTVIVLVDVQGLDYGEASQAIGKPVGTVKSRLSRGRARVQDCLRNVRELLPSSIRLVSEGT